MTTEVLLETNSYLRLAKRIRPAVGRQFGQVPYVVVILKAVEDEVHRNPELRDLAQGETYRVRADFWPKRLAALMAG